MRKTIAAMITMLLFITAAGAVETLPLLSALSIIGMAITVKAGQLDRE